jgi:hypothetical protein
VQVCLEVGQVGHVGARLTVRNLPQPAQAAPIAGFCCPAETATPNRSILSSTASESTLVSEA